MLVYEILNPNNPNLNPPFTGQREESKGYGEIVILIQFYYFIDEEIIGYNGLPLFNKITISPYCGCNNIRLSAANISFIDIINSFTNKISDDLDQEISVKDEIVVINVKLLINK